MTIEVNIDERLWAETQSLARDLKVDYPKLLADSIRKSLYDLKRKRDRELSTEEKIRRHRESYEKFPVQEDEFLLDDEMIEDVWKDL
ncbi:hypothetical protein BH20ACI2_BH20ACI2_23120 [soil metagenome]